MKQFDDLLFALGQLSEHAREYIDSKKKIFLLEVTEQGTKVLSKLISRIVILVFLIFLMLFGSLTLSIGLSMYFNSFLAGFGIVTGIYLLLIFIVILFRHRIITIPIANMILKDLNQ